LTQDVDLQCDVQTPPGDTTGNTVTTAPQTGSSRAQIDIPAFHFQFSDAWKTALGGADARQACPRPRDLVSTVSSTLPSRSGYMDAQRLPPHDYL